MSIILLFFKIALILCLNSKYEYNKQYMYNKNRYINLSKWNLKK